MGGFSNWPNYDLFIGQCWGSGPEFSGSRLGGASNIVVGSNPPFTATDFLSFYPKFGGNPLQIADCATVSGSPVVQLDAPLTGVAVGMQVTGSGIASGAAIQSYTADQTEVTLTLPCTLSASGVEINIFVSPFVPTVVLNAFIALASASLVQRRWQSTWALGMGFFIAHYCTLYMMSNGETYSSAGQAAIAGIARGITTQKSAGPTGQGIKPIDGLDDWGSFAMTLEGQQFITMARVIGGGPMLIH